MSSASGSNASSTTANVSFPLPKGHFGRIQVSAAQKQQYHEVARRRLDAMLADEKLYAERLASNEPCLSPTDWKFVRAHDELKIYRRRRRGRSLEEVAADEDFPEAVAAVANGQPSIVAMGSVAGSIEDMLYGFADTTHEEMRTTTSFLDPHTDSAMLRVFELATATDPLHFFGLKWLYNQEGPSAFVLPRDLCFLEAMGVEHDSDGKRYGYIVLHSIDLPECPPFDRQKTNVIRAKLFLTCVFRDAAPGVIDVLVRGIFDLGGELRRLAMPYAALMPYATASFIGGLLRSVDCADAKKLTLLARNNAVTGRYRDALNLHMDGRTPKHGVCAVCIKRGGTSPLSCLVRLRWCRICGVAICSKCSVKNKRVFLGSERPCSACVCCPSCAQEAQSMTDLRPAEPEYAVVADFFLETEWARDSDSDLLFPTPPDSPVDDDSEFSEQDVDSAAVMLEETWKNASSLNKTVTCSLDESWVGQQSIDGYGGTLSDPDTARYRFSSSSSESDKDYVFYSPTSQSGDPVVGQKSGRHVHENYGEDDPELPLEHRVD
ncbi:hypothetical protein BBJ28_00020228 [Nothophytophthora sp. Chile5]|nr:hypothetical protein BBJ28_00020228 [Nothophytophthora sp. Chile5]